MTTPTVRVRTRPSASAGKIATPDSNQQPPSGRALTQLALKVVYRPVTALQPSARNSRTHSHRQIGKIESSVRRFGFVRPILINSGGEIIAGAGLHAAAKNAGLTEVPTICLDHMTEAEVRAYRIADNRLAELAGWDEEILRIEFGDLLDIDFDLADSTGFETAEIDLIVDGEGSAKKSAADPADELPDLPQSAVSVPGDTWILGDHRLICGNARDPGVFARLMDDELAQVVVTDPPYNTRINGHVSPLLGQ